MSAITRPARKKVTIRRKPITALLPAEWDELWAFTSRYLDASRDTYERSVRQKHDAVIMRDAVNGALVGFGAVHTAVVDYEGKKRLVIYGGNVLIDDAYRGQNLIQRVGMVYTLKSRLRYPLLPQYYMFDTFSYKSYLMLSRNVVEFWPRRHHPTPPWEQGFLNFLAQARYGDAWDAERGVVHGTGDRRLKDWVAPIDTQQMQAPSIRFFALRNLGFRKGDLLVCLVPLNARNILSVFRNMFRRRKRKASRHMPKGA